MMLIFRQSGTRDGWRLHFKLMPMFQSRTCSCQYKMLPYEMKSFRFCAWSRIMMRVSLTCFLFQQPCANGGRCVLNNASSYACVCASGWSGQNCTINVNDCVRHWCQNGATCVDEIDGYRWVLKPWLSWGHSGTRMSTIAKAVTFTALLLQGTRNSF